MVQSPCHFSRSCFNDAGYRYDTFAVVDSRKSIVKCVFAVMLFAILLLSLSTFNECHRLCRKVMLCRILARCRKSCASRRYLLQVRATAVVSVSRGGDEFPCLHLQKVVNPGTRRRNFFTRMMPPSKPRAACEHQGP